MVELRTQIAELGDKVNSLARSQTFTSPSCSTSTPINSTLDAINESQKRAINVDAPNGTNGSASRTPLTSKRPASSEQSDRLPKYLRSH